jgi:hypothetical protein
MQTIFLRRAILILSIPLILLAACKKDKDDPETRMDLITSSSWKYSQAGIDTDNNGTIDIAAPAGFLQPCDTDNLIYFKSDLTGTVDEGATKCEAASPQSTPFVWSFRNNETEMNFPAELFAGVSGDVKIIELSSTKLTVSKQIAIPGFPIPITGPVVVVLTH